MSVLTAEPGAAPDGEEPPDTGERHRLTARTGLAALSLDAMTSVAYGPGAIVLVPAAAGRGHTASASPCRSRSPSADCSRCSSLRTGR